MFDLEAIAAVLVASGCLCVLGVVVHAVRAQTTALGLVATKPAPRETIPAKRETIPAKRETIPAKRETIQATPQPRNLPMPCVARPVGARELDLMSLN